MYNIRSKFIHGMMDLPYNHSHLNYSTNLIEKYHDEINEAAAISVKMLIATLQFCIVNNLNELDFKYSLNDN